MLCSGAASAEDPTIAFIGLHGGVFGVIEPLAVDAGLNVEYIDDNQIATESVDFSRFAIVFTQHLRDESREQLRCLIETGKRDNPRLRIVSISGAAEKMLPELAKSGMIEHDDNVTAYYGNSVENLRRLLIYTNVTFLDRPGNILPAESDTALTGLYHPDHHEMFANVDEFLGWATSQQKTIDNVPRVCIAVHSTHLIFQQRKVVEALIVEFEKQGALAVAMVDYMPTYEADLKEFKPSVVVHPCHSNERVTYRDELGVPHVSALFFRDQSINKWQTSLKGLTSSEMVFQIVGQELLGTIEPQVASGTTKGGGSEEAFLPIPDRIEHLVKRSLAWAKLSMTKPADKKIAFVYYDREMGKAELMRGSATGMFMNAPRSLVKILSRMKNDGYGISELPQTEDQLLAWMQDRGRQIGLWAPAELDRLARSGKAILVPTSQYEAWFNEHVPQAQRETINRYWGPPPGRFLTWKNSGEEFIVIPRIDLGKIVLLPQPLRGEAHDASLVHDLRVPPPHNYLATYFWLQKGFKTDAVVHFGTHGSEFMLPGKPTGLSQHDWPDILLGTIPNINLWVVNNLGESSPVRRRAAAVLIDHLVPPSVNAELSDELLNLHDDIDKWVTLGEGALKDKFRASITQQVREAHLETDLHWTLGDDELISGSQVRDVLAYLHDIHTETTPISLHVFGEPPRDDLLIPYLATCLRKEFLNSLSEVIEVPPEEALSTGDRDKYLRNRGERILKLIVEQSFTPVEAIVSVGGEVPELGLTDSLQDSFELVSRLIDGFRQTPHEIEGLLDALDGRFISPGPGNSADRNPAVLPTGRNMYVMNPEEVPTRPSWELGKQLVDQLLTGERKANGKHPEKIGFTLNSFATFQDYGVMESQIFYLLGVRPRWDARNLVADVELIPLDELGRPRIDVFIDGQSYYRDMLPTRMRLIDKAIRLVASTDEPAQQNWVRRNSLLVQSELEKQGIEPEKAKALSRARIFGNPEGQYGSAGYYYLIEKSGRWDSREELMEVYLSHHRNVYTDGMWGEAAVETYNQQIQGTEIVLRSWSDRTRSPLSNKYTWYHGGSLCLAVKHLAGKEPSFYLSDVRDSDDAGMVQAEDALRKDFRVRLLNRKWIEGMMKEGYAGADQVAVHVSNAMGWQVMRPGSVSDDLWQAVVETYIRDKKNLSIREWFESENPFAYQDMTEVLLETIRKGYWQPDSETIREIAREYAQSVVRHGEGGGLRGGGNIKLEAFVQEVLQAPGNESLKTLASSYAAKANEASIETPSKVGTQSESAKPVANVETIEGTKLVERQRDDVEMPTTALSRFNLIILGLTAVCLGLVLVGYQFRWGA
ncbi:cobaltochelatase subunit CobN [Planctomycetes bacterium TBK1r]